MTARDEPSPLAGLDAVDWSLRWDCAGDVDRVPSLLRQLWTGSSGAVGELRKRLAPDHSLHTCVAVRDATPAAVPFLVRLAQDKSTPKRGLVLDLLLRIVDAVADGPVETCFGRWPEAWLTACGRALSETGVEEWFALLDSTRDGDRRRDVLRLLAIGCWFDSGGLVFRLWQSVLDAPDAGHLAERLIGLAYATRGPARACDDTDGWAVQLSDWLEQRPYPSSADTGDAVSIALRHLPGWIDTGTVDALADLVHDEPRSGGADTPRTG